MSARFLLLALSAALASATPLTLTLVGIGSGSIGGTSFVDQSFTFTFDTNTACSATITNCVMFGPSSEPTDYTTPYDTPATFSVDGNTYTLDGAQAVFEHPGSEERLGIWQENLEDWLTITDPAFANYNLQTDLTVDAPSSEVTALSGTTDPLLTSGGNLFITSIEPGSTTVFTAALATTTSTTGVISSAVTAPEPSSVSLLLLGGAGLCVGMIRRRRT